MILILVFWRKIEEKFIFSETKSYYTESRENWFIKQVLYNTCYLLNNFKINKRMNLLTVSLIAIINLIK